MKKILLLAITLIPLAMFAQQGDGGTPRGFKFGPDLRDVDAYVHPSPDIDALRAEDEENDKSGTTFWRFGYHHQTNYTLQNSGTWTTLPNGDKIWQLIVKSEGALTINLIFDNLEIPEGCELFIYNPSKTFVLGKFVQNHVVEGQLGSELVPGNTAVVEYYIPKANSNNPGSLRLKYVSHGYRTAEEYLEKAFGQAGSCNMNVNCPDGAPWDLQKRGAVMLASSSQAGSGFCSGSLINNTANDGKPYVLTANHCYSNPATWWFRFNWQSATCSNPGSSPTYQSLTGAVLRARRTPSDFCLVEITGGLSGGTVPAAYNPYFSGWDNSGTIPTSAVCIHHPSGDIKKISFDDNPPVLTGTNNGGFSTENNSTWQVHWDRNTTTEGGSSGSPLFDQNGRIIGQLWGGGASCANLSAPDYYGRLSNSWAPPGSNNTNQLKAWLDPGNSGVTAIDGYDPFAITYANDAQMMSVQSPVTGVTCNNSFTPQVTIKNNGTNTITSMPIRYRVNNGTEVNFNWTGSLATGATAQVSLPNFTATVGVNTFKVYTALAGDQNAANDTATISFTVLSPTGVSLPVSEGFESPTFPPTGWELVNPENNATWARTTAAASEGSASARKDNLNSNDAGQVDNLLTPFMNFSGFTGNTLTFKVAYARYSATYFDSLIIWATADCGNTWTRVYNKGNTTLATNGGANLTTTFVPNANQWRLETVDLSQFSGQSNVRLNFQNKSGYGNFIYIDDINITGSTSPAPPTSSFSASTTTPCVGQTVSFTNTSTGATSYSWTFPGGTPGTSTSPNPTVVYNSPGTYTVTLTSTNTFGSQNSTESITVGALPATPAVSSNSPAPINGSLNLFANGSAGSYFWTGPNGFTSNDQNPQINNPGTGAGGQYCVYVVASGCTSQTACTQVVVSGYVSVNNTEAFDVAIFPNPTKDVVNIHKGDNAAVRVKLTDMTGKTVIQDTVYSDAQFTLDLGNFAGGIYFLSLENEKGTVIRKIVKP
jgi:PKD repeat protein